MAGGTTFALWFNGKRRVNTGTVTTSLNPATSKAENWLGYP